MKTGRPKEYEAPAGSGLEEHKLELLDLSNVGPHSALLVTINDYVEVPDMAQALTALRAPHLIPIVFLRQGQSIETLNEAEMNRRGWYRK